MSKPSAFPMIDFSSGHLGRVIDRAVDDLFSAGASDITIQSDDYIWAYINRQHMRVSSRRLDDGEMTTIIRHLNSNDAVFGKLGAGQSVDFDADVRPYLDPSEPDFDPDYSIRCRANLTQCRVGNTSSGYSLTLRTIPGVPPSFEALNLPSDVALNFFPVQGLVLVVGITGSGKSTLLAAANRARLENADSPVKIGTYEDPIEFIYPRLAAVTGELGAPSARMPEISQVQLGLHLKDFSLAAPNALRRKFDVLVMGEMRDRVSVETGLLLAATGHATYGTLHCETPADAIARVVSEFPYDSQPGVANKLLSNLRLIVAQKIQLTTSGKGKAYRSWCVFDQEFKATLFEMQHPQWSRLITKRVEEKGHSFAQQALPDYLAGLLSKKGFEDVAGFNPVEARDYLAKHSPSHQVARPLEVIEHD